MKKEPSSRSSTSKLNAGGGSSTSATAIKKRQRKKPEVFGFEATAASDSDSNDDSDSMDSDSMMNGDSDLDEMSPRAHAKGGRGGSRRSLQSGGQQQQQQQASTMMAGSIDSNASGSLLNSDSLFDLMMSSKSRDPYFWQYNVQSKGPKTKKVLTLRNRDPHLHRDFHDPVFQLQNLNSRSGTSLNKLRKGDGNDVTPNPEKLYSLGNQINEFMQKSFQINNACFNPSGAVGGGNVLGSMSGSANLVSSPNAHVPLSVSLDAMGGGGGATGGSGGGGGGGGAPRVNLKREKNKIASRACRLKKKAQHEANKIKLFGLNEEHSK